MQGFHYEHLLSVCQVFNFTLKPCVVSRHLSQGPPGPPGPPGAPGRMYRLNGVSLLSWISVLVVAIFRDDEFYDGDGLFHMFAEEMT